MHSDRSGDRRGFTLVELMVALVIGAGLLLAGRLLLEQVGAAEHVIVADSAARDSEFVRTRTLQSLVRNLEVGTDSVTTFSGNEHVTLFTSWVVDSTGQRTRSTVRVQIDTILTVTAAVLPSIVLSRSAHAGVRGEFRYLGDARQGGVWYRTWGPSLLAPLAIGVIMGTDTLVLRIGERG